MAVCPPRACGDEPTAKQLTGEQAHCSPRLRDEPGAGSNVLGPLRATANRPHHPMQPADLGVALESAAALGIIIEATPWSDVRRAWQLAHMSLRYADAIYVAAAERLETALLITDSSIHRSGAMIGCEVITVRPDA